jgi:DNA polymerase-1
MQVHDELVLEVRQDAIGPVTREVRKRMIAAAGEALRVPLKVEVGTGANWEEAH